MLVLVGFFFFIDLKYDVLDGLDVLCKSSALIWLYSDQCVPGEKQHFFTSLEKICLV